MTKEEKSVSEDMLLHLSGDECVNETNTDEIYEQTKYLMGFCGPWNTDIMKKITDIID